MEEWLPKCIESCIQQTYTNIEILAVNDGSTDNCKEIIEAFGKKDERVILIDKTNGGLNSAREAGINQATGEYITILDGDDFLELQALEILLSYTKQYDIDIIIGRSRNVRAGDFKILNEVIGEAPGLLDKVEYLKFLLRNGRFSVCMKLYRSELIKTETEYPNLLALEDIILTMQWGFRSTRVVFIPDVVYNYVVGRPGSILTTDRTARAEGAFACVYYLFDWISRTNRIQDIKKEFINFLCFRLYVYLNNPRNQFRKNKHKISEIFDFIHDHKESVAGKQFKFMVSVGRINIILAHHFVHKMQRIKPTFHSGFKRFT